ncbi:hypothetical protein HYY70_03660 [Candidatus Woesearchaeota archaeon]|nr:hypothetical protein [Candidatus Woesearchaeota archaeon]
MAQGGRTLIENPRKVVELSYLVGDDTWKTATLEIFTTERTGMMARIGQAGLEVLVNVKTALTQDDKSAAAEAINHYCKRTYVGVEPTITIHTKG